MKEKAQAFAAQRHCGQTYDGKPYAETHLPAVVQVLVDFGFTDDHWIAAAWTHDTIEDTETTKAEIEAEFGSETAELVWAVTGVGENRKARNASIYEKITALPRAAILKLADRIANVEAAKGTRYAEMYAKELPAFEEVIRPHVPAAMWDRLIRAFQ